MPKRAPGVVVFRPSEMTVMCNDEVVGCLYRDDGDGMVFRAEDYCTYTLTVDELQAIVNKMRELSEE